MPTAAFTGTRRSYPLRFGEIDARLDVLEGALRGVAQEKPACRVQVSGAPSAQAAFAAELTAFAADLAADAGLTVPRAGLAADAVAVARGTKPAPRRLGSPAVLPGTSVAESLCLLAGHLADVILYWAPLAPVGEAPEPVHQMRVALRRLRAAVALYRRIAVGPALSDFGDALRDLAARLGAARDWDVFLGATGRDVQAAFAEDARIGGLLAAAARRRAAAYAALRTYLESEFWRRLSLRLALLPTAQPWRDPGDVEQAELLAAPAREHAIRVLDRVHRRVQQAGADLAALPPQELHATRKQAKKLRYATEYFGPLFPNKRVKRFLERLEDLQEALGAVNDGHVAATLMAQLGGGADRSFAAGAVQGYVAGTRHTAAARAAKTWTKYLRQEIFWS